MPHNRLSPKGTSFRKPGWMKYDDILYELHGNLPIHIIYVPIHTYIYIYFYQHLYREWELEPGFLGSVTPTFKESNHYSHVSRLAKWRPRFAICLSVCHLFAKIANGLVEFLGMILLTDWIPKLTRKHTHTHTVEIGRRHAGLCLVTSKWAMDGHIPY